MAKDIKDSAEIPVNSPPTVSPEREARWEAFLTKARLVNPARFDAQKANHEFDTIPDSFL